MGKIKENLIKEYLSCGFNVGDTVKVKGKYLTYNESRDGDWWNTLNVVMVKKEGDDTVLYVQRKGYSQSSYKGSIDRVVVTEDSVKKYVGHIGADPIPEKQWDSCVRNTGLNFHNIIFRIISDIKKDESRNYIINGIYIPELNYNPFVYGKDGERLYYQRDYVWTLEDEQNFIESIYNHLNLGTVVIRKRSWKWIEKETASRTKKDNVDDIAFYDIVDGKQRLHTVFRFMTDQFPDKHGNYYSDLSDIAQYKFEEGGSMAILEIEEDAKDEDVLRVFLNVNYTGKPLSQDHLDYVKGLFNEKL